MKILRLKSAFGEDELEHAVVDLLAKSRWEEDIYLRILAFESSDVVGTFALEATASILITALPRASRLGSDATSSCSVSSWRRISDDVLPPRVKAVANYLNSRYALLQAMADGYDDAILLDASGHVAESSGSCLFAVRGDALVTPLVTSDILESVTRATLMTLAQDELGLAVVERALDRTELYIADEIFLCGTGGGEVTPVTAVDRYVIGSGQVGPITARIQTLYHDVVRAASESSSKWLTPVVAAEGGTA
jgi:branched-chain amino acid aminotransferase